MTRPALVPAIALALLTALAAPAAAARAPIPDDPATAAPPGIGCGPGMTGVVERFGGDPLAGEAGLPFFTEGDAAGRFAWIGDEPPHFPGDRPGTLRVLYDTTLPTTRLSTPLGDMLSMDRDFAFGAVLTIRSAGFAADPAGFSQIAFGVWNARTTGTGRTAFPSDTFDLVEADFFANVTDFGGPFLAPSVFGGDVGGNAFFNFAFQAAEVRLPFDVPLLVRAEYSAASRRLTLSAARHAGGTVFQPIPDASVEVDLAHVSPAFLVDVLGIAAYGEGWPSLHATVDYDLIWCGRTPPPFGTGRRAAVGLRGQAPWGTGEAPPGLSVAR
jgi:hypothetical protein